MSEPEKQEGQKTVVAFIVGLLIGGLLVMLFSGNPSEAPSDTNSTNNENAEEVEIENDTDEDTEPEQNGNNEDTAEATDNTPVMITGDGAVTVSDQSAGNIVRFDGIVFPLDEGWVAIRSFTDGQLGNVLGASRFSKEQGLVPESVQLLAPTVAGREYAIVFFTEDGDRRFNLATDVQIEGIFGTFTAN